MVRRRGKKGLAIGEAGRSPERVKELREFVEEADRQSDLRTWRRGFVVLGYVEGRSVARMAAELAISKSAIKKWICRYEQRGVSGLFTGYAPGPGCRLSEAQREELVRILEEGPIAAGFSAGLWTGPMIRQLIEQRFGVHFSNQHIPRMLHTLGFSVQRPRKLLARANPEAQRAWREERLPEIKKKSLNLAANSSSKTKPASGSMVPCTRRGPPLGFIRGWQLDNGPCHWLDTAGKAWLASNQDKIELHRLPPYSPEFNPQEGVWKITRKLTTHNRFYATVTERDAALTNTFERFRSERELILPQVTRLQ